jgi:hypothetical protein
MQPAGSLGAAPYGARLLPLQIVPGLPSLCENVLSPRWGYEFTPLCTPDLRPGLHSGAAPRLKNDGIVPPPPRYLSSHTDSAVLGFTIPRLRRWVWVVGTKSYYKWFFRWLETLKPGKFETCSSERCSPKIRFSLCLCVSVVKRFQARFIRGAGSPPDLAERRGWPGRCQRARRQRWKRPGQSQPTNPTPGAGNW